MNIIWSIIFAHCVAAVDINDAIFQIPRYNESCSSDENARICESDCIMQYQGCIDDCSDQG